MLYGADGEVVRTIDFEPDAPSPEDGAVVAFFSVDVDSPVPPLSRVEWEGHDPNGNALTYSVFATVGNGRWRLNVQSMMRKGSERTEPVSFAVLGVFAVLVFATMLLGWMGNEAPTVARLGVQGTTVYSAIEGAWDERWAASLDGGFTWASSDDRADSWSEPQREVCRRDGRCFAIADDSSSVLEREPDGDWQVSFAFVGDEWRILNHRVPFSRETTVGFGQLLVVDVEGGEQVVVTAGSDGVMVLDPDGTWHRRAVLDARPASVSGVYWPIAVGQWVLLLAAPAALVAIAWAWARSLPEKRVTPWAIGVLLMGLVVGSVVWVVGWAPYTIFQIRPPGPIHPLVHGAWMAGVGALVVAVPVREVQRGHLAEPTAMQNAGARVMAVLMIIGLLLFVGIFRTLWQGLG